MRLLAIDPGSNHCGVAVFEDGTLKSTSTIDSNALTPLARRLGVAHALKSQIQAAKRVISEEPFLQGKANTGMQRLLGMIELMSGQTVTMIHPMSVKSLIAKGSREKIDLALAAGELLKTDKEKEILAQAIQKEAFDETDAVAIGLTYFIKERAKNAI